MVEEVTLPQEVRIETINPINNAVLNKFDETSINRLLPKIDPTWIQLFPEFNVYRFLSVDDYSSQHNKARSTLKYKPIILINGYQSSRLTWNFFAQQLWNTGFRSIFALELKDFSKSIDKFYTLLDSAIETILSFLNIFDKVTLIGHSLGGIFARYYVKYRDEQKKPNVSLLITLAAPHYGILKSFHYFESFFKLFFEPEAVDLFSLEKGVHVDINNIFHEREVTEITMINVQGSLKRLAGGDGIFKPEPVSEMINIVEHRNHFRIHKSHRVFNHLKEFLSENVSVFKIQLKKIEFPSIQILHNFYIYFTIKLSGIKQQRFPVMDEIEISSNELIFNDPIIIFAGKSNLFERQKTVTLSLYRKKRLSSEKLIEQEISIDMLQNKSCMVAKVIQNQIISFNIRLITYNLEKKSKN